LKKHFSDQRAIFGPAIYEELMIFSAGKLAINETRSM
jgi:hypothetical protein